MVAGGWESYHAECNGSGVSVDALSLYNFTSALIRLSAGENCDAYLSASNSCTLEYIENMGSKKKVKIGITIKKETSVIASESK